MFVTVEILQRMHLVDVEVSLYKIKYRFESVVNSIWFNHSSDSSHLYVKIIRYLSRIGDF